MIYIILDAYEIKMKPEDTFLKQLNKMSTIQKVLLTFVGMLGIIQILLVFRGYDKILHIYTLVNMMILIIIAGYLEKSRKRNFQESFEKYDARLKKLEEILISFEFTTEEKMKAIIAQLDLFIEESENNRNKEQENNKEFNGSIILPIGTFVLGIFADSINNIGQVRYAIALLIILFVFRLIAKDVRQIYLEIIDRQYVKMKKLSMEIKDLYIRKYV